MLRIPAIRVVLALLAPLLLAPAPAAAQAAAREAAPTTVILVRHAEKAAVEGRDPPLSEAGRARALALADALADAGVQRVYSTQFVRTRDTARPVAERLGLPVQEWQVTSMEEYLTGQAREILERHAGETVLVVGHSNTTPLLVRALGGPAMEEIAEDDYGNLFVVTIPAEGPVRTLRARYGAP